MLVTGSDAPSQNSQLLILAELIETVRNLHPIARREEIEMEDIDRRRLPVEVVENALIVADVVNGQKFRCVQKVTGAAGVERGEVSILGPTEPKRGAPAPGSERAPLRIDIPERLRRSQAGPRGRIDDQTRLVSILRVRRAGNQFHALQRIGGYLGREQFTLLVADGLSVDHNRN